MRQLARTLWTVPVIGPHLRTLWRSGRRAVLGNDRIRLLKRLPRGARGAEIGVWKGGFSAMILEHAAPSLLCLVDPWAFQSDFPDRWYGGALADGQAKMDAIHDEVAARFRDVPAVRIFRQTSVDFFKTFEEPLDWVYIDGDHGAEPVYQDLTLAWDCVRPGGLIAGDDYYWQDSDGTLAVKAAVARFSRDRGCDVTLFGTQFLIERH